jgi:hypothetical protein
MSSDLSQFEIPGSRLLATNSQPRADIRTDIGEAKITQTIFGRAKVRVIRKQDKTRHAWLLTLLVVTVVAAASWQGWVALQQMQNTVTLPIETVRVSAPVFQPEYIPLPALSPLQVGKPGMPPQAGSSDLIFSLKNTPQQTPAFQPVVQVAAKPPLIESKPQTDKPQAAPATNNPVKSPAVMQQPRKPLPARRPVTPTVVAKPAVTQPASPAPSTTQSIAPAVAPQAQPSSKETAPASSPAITNQSLAPVNIQPQANTSP